MLEVRDVRAGYGDINALWGVTLEVREGEVVALIGPNGAGKTTLMRTIAGLHRPSAGGVYLNTQSIHTLPAHRIMELGVVLVPEGRHIFSGMRVIENLEIGAYSRAARQQREKTLKWVYEIFPILAERSHQIAGTMSGGQQQMLAIGRALMGRPKVLLLDEPSLGLAPIMVQEIFGVLREVNKQGLTVLIVEQNARQALQLANRAYVIEQGRIEFEGAASALLSDAGVRRAYLGEVVASA